MNPIPMVYLFLTLTAVLAITSNAAAVRDIIGTPLVSSQSYYVIPVIRGQGGGVTVSGRGGMPCPLDIVQARSNVNHGEPVRFSNWSPKIASVPESENLNIKSIVGTVCMQPTYWWVDEFDNLRKTRFLTTGPKPADVPEQDSLKGFFQIKKAGKPSVYKFVFCPENCTDVGIFIDELGVRRLALSSEPFLVKFVNADRSEDSSKIMSVVSK